MGTQFVWSLNSMNTKERYKIQESIKDAVVILDSAPIHRDLISETMIVQLTNRLPVAHLAIERGLKALITAAGGEYDKGRKGHGLNYLYRKLRDSIERGMKALITGGGGEYDKGRRGHGLNYLYRKLGNSDEDSADFLAEAFQDAVKFFGYNVNYKGFGHFRSLDDYLSQAGTERTFERLRYWAIEPTKKEEPFKYIAPSIHRELLYALWSLFFSKRRETVSARVEREVAEAMYNKRGIFFCSDDTSKEQSVRRYEDWLKKHTTRSGALEEAAHQIFVIGDDFANQTVRDAYDDLRQSKDPAVQYYIRTLTYLPKGSQGRNPDARPVSKPNQDLYPTAVTVATPAGRDLGIIERYPDGAWGISPSEDVQETNIAEALADAKAYLVNRLTKQVTVTVNGESKQLRMVGEDFYPVARLDLRTTLHIRHRILGRKSRLAYWRRSVDRTPMESKPHVSICSRRYGHSGRKAKGLD